ncbi:hypothetical protein BpHYR1_040600 [Brachionus plicatilis]|uniref:Uncharacterized protein n=1 Tax=Brachionus plicatilis TaxID=10195 RepID=A0A3M7RHP4_BRAPC|nr:hypothetical protein BpHYR1_040600 [Brachionus plicatilis]
MELKRIYLQFDFIWKNLIFFKILVQNLFCKSAKLSMGKFTPNNLKQGDEELNLKYHSQF